MRDIERVWNYYAAGRIARPRPRYLCFNATLRCDGKCGHCGIWKHERPGRELTAAELGQVLGSSLFSRIETAWITGGEPTLRDDVDEISRVMVSSLPSLSILGIATNALDPERVLDRVGSMLESAGNDIGVFVHVSLDGVGEVHDRVRRRPGAFQSVLATIERLSSLGREHRNLEAGLNCVIQPGNVDGLSELHEFAREKGLALMFNVVLVTDQVYRNLSMSESLTLSDDDRKKAAAFLERIMDQSPPAFQYQYRIIQEVLAGKKRPRRCLTLDTTININADGTLIPCPAASDVFPESVLDSDPEALWKSRETKRMRKSVRENCCGSCMLSCSLGDSMPLSEWLKGGWDKRPAPGGSQ